MTDGSQHTLLVVEDDASIRAGLVEALSTDRYRVVEAVDGAEAVRIFADRSINLVLLDLMLPGMNGYDVCRLIREQCKRTPIIMLTAKGEEIDKVPGLELGADDYVTKPFGVRKLLARVHVALRRWTLGPASAADPDAPAEEATFIFGTAIVDRRHYTAELEGTSQSLSARELQLIEYLHARPIEVLSREIMRNAVWGVDYDGTTRTLDQHIAQVRKKVAGDHGLRLIRTIHGVGYKYVP